MTARGGRQLDWKPIHIFNCEALVMEPHGLVFHPITLVLLCKKRKLRRLTHQRLAHFGKDLLISYTITGCSHEKYFCLYYNS